jgi:probable HAF family extracellular repeat protein
VIWENGKPIDIGNLGAKMWDTPMAINQRGDVVGFYAVTGTDPDNPLLLSFLWTREGGMQSLGALPGDNDSEALGINERRQIVGLSCNAAGVCRAYLWQNGVMTDLNSIVAPPYNNFLQSAQDINDLGEITGRAVDPVTGDRPAYLAVPIFGRSRS